MWKQWTNLILGILIVGMAFYGTGTGWIVGAGILIVLVALWAVLDGSPNSARPVARVS